jgi:transposase-like protein
VLLNKDGGYILLEIANRHLSFFVACCPLSPLYLSLLLHFVALCLTFAPSTPSRIMSVVHDDVSENDVLNLDHESNDRHNHGTPEDKDRKERLRKLMASSSIHSSRSNPRSKLTDEQRLEIVHQHEAHGQGKRRLSRAFGVHTSTVRDILRKQDLIRHRILSQQHFTLDETSTIEYDVLDAPRPLGYKSLSIHQRNEIVEFFRNGRTQMELARLYRVGRGTIRHTLRKSECEILQAHSQDTRHAARTKTAQATTIKSNSTHRTEQAANKVLSYVTDVEIGVFLYFSKGVLPFSLSCASMKAPSRDDFVDCNMESSKNRETILSDLCTLHSTNGPDNPILQYIKVEEATRDDTTIEPNAIQCDALLHDLDMNLLREYPRTAISLDLHENETCYMDI